MVYALIVAYRGTAYAGWQRQENALGVQEVVETALADLLVENVRTSGAGRTDAGVHARGQVVHLKIEREFPLSGLIHGTNQRLPEDIRVLRAQRMSEGFHARKSALAKEYRYRLVSADRMTPLEALLAVPTVARLDVSAMQRAAACLVGEHDFTAFALAGGSHASPLRRIFAARWWQQRAAVEFQIVGTGFLRGMVRSIVGTLLEVGTGRRCVADVACLLEGRPRGEAGPTAPAKGLTLERVFYPAPWRGELWDEPVTDLLSPDAVLD